MNDAMIFRLSQKLNAKIKAGPLGGGGGSSRRDGGDVVVVGVKTTASLPAASPVP